MGFIDLIRELRTGEPDLKKATKTMKFLGWGCLLGGLWNFILPQVASFKEADFHLPAYYPYFALIVFSIIGALFLFSARGIREMEPWGKKAGQAAIMLLFAGVFLFSALVMPDIVRFPTDGSFVYSSSLQWLSSVYRRISDIGTWDASLLKTIHTAPSTTIPTKFQAPFPREWSKGQPLFTVRPATKTLLFHSG
jgi:hypothetical protein